MKTLTLVLVLIILAMVGRSSLPEGDYVQFKDIKLNPEMGSLDLALARGYLAVNPPRVEDHGLWKTAILPGTGVKWVVYPGSGGWVRW